MTISGAAEKRYHPGQGNAMQKFDITEGDRALVEAAAEAVGRPVLQIYGEKSPPLVGAALRLDDGEIITGVNLITDVGSISMCAEPFAIAEANRRAGRRIETIVAVYQAPGAEPKVVAPCGRCREVIIDFNAQGFVILRDPGSDILFKVRAPDLLPMRYGDYWKGGDLV